jgi:DNA-binding transcriptional LysR family regulator
VPPIAQSAATGCSDFAETWLPAALGQFKRTHPLIRVEASVDRNAVLLERLEKGQLDLAMFFSDGQHQGAERLATLPMVWIGNAERAWDPTEPVPLVLFEAPWVFRKAVLQRLMPPESPGGSHLRVPVWRVFGRRSRRALG